MLHELDIRNVGPISKASLPFDSGMTAITGETGAGKSMLLNAIGMIMGMKASRGINGSSNSYAQGVFTGFDEEYHDEDDGMTYVSRTFGKSGRSKCMINGLPVPINALQSMMEQQITIHGQSEQMRLASSSMQLDIIDMYADDDVVISDYQRIHAQVDEIKAIMDKGRNADAIARADYLHECIERISRADIKIGELKELRTTVDNEEQRLADVERKTKALQDIEASMELLREASSLVPDDDLDTAVSLIARIDGMLSSSLSDDEDFNVDDINERIYEIEHIIKRYGGDERTTIDFLDKSQHELDDINASMHDADELEQRLGEALREERKIAASLHGKRVKAADSMQKQINEELAHLSMPGASVSIGISSAEPKSNGYDKVSFMFMPFDGSEPMPLGKSASGGELSRLMLAIELVVAEHSGSTQQTFVFDEVDAGVGGKAAADLGKRLCRLSMKSQVIIVTHLAQVAAYANHQCIVERHGNTTTIKPADNDGREHEISRMMSGEQDDISIRHARSLLKKSDDYRSSLR